MSNFDLGPSLFDEAISQDKDFDLEEDLEEIGLLSALKKPFHRHFQRGGSGDSGVSGAGEVDEMDDGQHRQSEAEEEVEEVEEDLEDFDEEDIEEFVEEVDAEAELVAKQAKELKNKPKKKSKPKQVEKVTKQIKTVTVAKPADFDDLVFDEGVSFKSVSTKESAVKIPIELIDTLRTMLVPFGSKFAEKISNKSLVASFIAAMTGSELQFDENTAQAVTAFEMSQPATGAIEFRLKEMQEQMKRMRVAERKTNSEIIAIRRDVAALIKAESWQLADRLHAISASGGDTVETMELDHKLAKLAHDTLNNSVKEELEREQRAKDSPFK